MSETERTDLVEDARVVLEDGLQQLQPEGPRYLPHTHQPNGRLGIYDQAEISEEEVGIGGTRPEGRRGRPGRRLPAGGRNYCQLIGKYSVLLKIGT